MDNENALNFNKQLKTKYENQEPWKRDSISYGGRVEKKAEDPTENLIIKSWQLQR